MSKAERVGDPGDQVRQWVTDDKPCQPLALPNGYSTLTLEVKGELAGKGVTFKGGLTDKGEMPFLAHTRLSPWLLHIPAVLHLQPVTDAVGITITVRGVQ